MSKKMSKAQLNAISRAYSARNRRMQERELDERGLRDVWEYQTVYKSLSGFLRASDARIAESKKSAIENIQKRMVGWRRLGQTTHNGYKKYGEALARIMRRG